MKNISRKYFVIASLILLCTASTYAQCTYLKGIVAEPCDGCPEEGRHEMLVFKTGATETNFSQFEVYVGSTNPAAQTKDYFRNGFINADHGNIASDLSFANNVMSCDAGDYFIAADSTTIFPPNSIVITKNYFIGNLSPLIYDQGACPEGPVYVMYRSLAADQLSQEFTNNTSGEDAPVYITVKTDGSCTQNYSYDPDSLVVDKVDAKLAGAWVMFDEAGNTVKYGNNGKNYPFDLVRITPKGAICDDPIEAVLPYSITGLSTENMGNHYDVFAHSSLVFNDCQNNGELAEGNDVIFHFVPTCDTVVVDFSTDKDMFTAYLQEGCLGGTCVFSKHWQFGITSFSEKAAVTVGKDYYILIDSRISAPISRTIDVSIQCKSTVTSVQKRNVSDVTVSPNPTSGQVNINLGESASKVSINIRSVDGKLMRTITQSNVQYVPIELEKSGLYLIEVLTDYSTTNLKVVVE